MINILEKTKTQPSL